MLRDVGHVYTGAPDPEKFQRSEHGWVPGVLLTLHVEVERGELFDGRVKQLPPARPIGGVEIFECLSAKGF